MQKFSQKLNSISLSANKYIVACLLLVIPLYPKFPFINIPGTYVAIRLEDFMIAILTLVWILLNIRSLRKLIEVESAKRMFLFWGVGALSLASAIWITQSVFPQVGLLHWLRRVEYMIPFFIGLTSIAKKENVGFYVKCIVIAVLYMSIYGVGQKYFNWPIVTTQNEEYSKGVALRYIEGGHIVSTFAGHYDMASYLLLMIPLLSLVATSSRKVANEIFGRYALVWRGLSFIAIVLGMWLLANAASRISMVSFLGAIVLAFLLARRYLLIPVFVALTIVISLMSGSLIARYGNIYDVVTKKIFSIQIIPSVHAAESSETEDRSTSIRLNIEWPRAVRALSRNPILGTGYSSITLATDNDYLRMLGEIGLLGATSFFLLFLEIVISLLVYIKRVGKHANLFVISVIASIPAILLNMVFIDILEASKFAIVFWLVLGVAYAIGYEHKENS